LRALTHSTGNALGFGEDWGNELDQAKRDMKTGKDAAIQRRTRRANRRVSNTVVRGTSEQRIDWVILCVIPKTRKRGIAIVRVVVIGS